ncbi:NADPH-dependent FMN reductase [Methanococcus vannielii SB]|uniref:NADPH-dependent FMN reductase n=1 Tax=Methanococcus vannielii (strain ATCC 35089 / DSM 1224 / JCM 13029 / OCM 148 / SB) TaxID=406327 RepID=A6UNW2_METVS|nr:flavodoxin family protein [Methanococcus vannielii]ABR54184.1 NADPH-dependent FMN reductase [Methanococcus vannielii SB]
MSKYVLVISASPRKGGNSDLLCDQFITGAKEAGNLVEKIFICDKKINYCTGCGTCFGTKTCPQNDDMGEILDKMVDVDAIVMATPVYFYTMNGQMKTLIDRTCARYTEINNKEFYFIVAAADNSKHAMERTFEGFQAFLSCLDGAVEKGRIYGTGAWNIGDIVETDAMTQAYEMGRSI